MAAPLLCLPFNLGPRRQLEIVLVPFPWAAGPLFTTRAADATNPSIACGERAAARCGPARAWMGSRRGSKGGGDGAPLLFRSKTGPSQTRDAYTPAPLQACLQEACPSRARNPTAW
ncbi:uncharacterized protein PSFLO_03074 [Pseudozyma flocculosa]|uniref:Uncharacterized protein n=1 Tax=Pseudozyma flocculosa TaxID=84751 RepID=A0A5C3F2D8_9BASI|nr:uncharacterized protein PSFLO_03074 [Pseudozyma flocculosa]